MAMMNHILMKEGSCDRYFQQESKLQENCELVIDIQLLKEDQKQKRITITDKRVILMKILKWVAFVKNIAQHFWIE